jgi:hypothetical protein
VLFYNDINVWDGNVLNKQFGWQLGWWNGLNTQAPLKAGERFTLAPNVIRNGVGQTSDYTAVNFAQICMDDNTNLAGRFYFLQVQVDTTGIWSINKDSANVKNTGYQWNREYVLSTALNPAYAGGDGNKYLTIVPKEVQRTTDSEYWRFPYDSVNMAAHWEIQLDQTALLAGDSLYRFINMLGDTLKFAAGANSGQYPLAGGYQTVNGLIPGGRDQVLAPTTSASGNAGFQFFGRPAASGQPYYSHWFPKTPLYGTTTCDTWRIHQLKGSSTFTIESACTPGVTLSSSTWYNGFPQSCMQAGIYNGGTKAGQPYYYYQQNVQLINTPAGLLAYPGVFDACGGLKITKKEIYYVPTNGAQFGAGQDNGIINSNDMGKGAYPYNDATAYLKQDSLTAYTWLTGNYDIVEANGVHNELELGYAPVQIYDGKGTIANVARLVTKPANGKLQFIPLDGSTSNEPALRKAMITTNAGTYYANNPGDSLSYLYGETYKWYLVKSGNKYLSFDTVNVAGGTNREKVGLIFADSLINAIPVRLYQPLVGDKKASNFLFQFYMPLYKYVWNKDLNKWRAWTNIYPDIESSTLTATVTGLPNQVCFATLSNQTDFIYATRAYSRVTTATRFTIANPESVTCKCIGEFITPGWMAQQRLLSLPLNNQIWINGAAQNAWVGTGVKTPTLNPGTTTTSNLNSPNWANATLYGNTKTTLTHTYVATIKNGWVTLKGKDNKDVSIGSDKSPVFATDLEVPLYYVQNADGQYLTVVPDNDMSDPRATDPDVNGVKLAWTTTKFGPSSATGLDSIACQLFAISGCMTDTVSPYGEFVYLPMGSYQFHYDTRSFTATSDNKFKAIFHNVALGSALKGATCPGNDLTNCWRIGNYQALTDSVQHLVVFNAKAGGSMSSIVPVQVKWSKNAYILPPCTDVTVQSVAAGAMKGKFYTFDSINPVAVADSTTLFAHWQIQQPQPVKDPFLVTYAPELKKVYDQEVGIGKTIPQTTLLGKYYFIKKVKTTGYTDSSYVAINVAGFDTANYAVVYDTLQIACTSHALPFFDLEKDGHLNLINQLAILETPAVDRSLTDILPAGTIQSSTPTPIYRVGSLIPYAYRTYIYNAGTKFESAKYLTVYPENRRVLAGVDKPGQGHVIPYYSFSYTDNGGNEYFLNVDTVATGVTNRTDSIYWTLLSGTNRDNLVKNFAVAGHENDFRQFKFCLPYKVVTETDHNLDATQIAGVRVPLVKYMETFYPPVYMQTLDYKVGDTPRLVVTGNSSVYTSAITLDGAYQSGVKQPTAQWNIYSVNYRYIDPMQVTSWIFGGQNPAGNIWVPLWTAIAGGADKGITEGVLTNYKVGNGGVTFMDQSKDKPVNWGTVTGIGNAPTLTVHFEGDTLIGSYALRPIWYYRIELKGTSLYLTDATDSVKKNPAYQFNVMGVNNRPYGYFGAKLPNKAQYVKQDIYADSTFIQTFGFRYVTSDTAKNQEFYIVSNANYNGKTDESTFRYLASINDRLVFVDKAADAMVFQYGKVGSDGKYTGIEAVGQGNIYGVQGGVKFLSGNGKADIYSIDGRLIKSVVLTGSDQVVDAPRGIAIVKNGSKVVKVVVQ